MLSVVKCIAGTVFLRITSWFCISLIVSCNYVMFATFQCSYVFKKQVTVSFITLCWRKFWIMGQVIWVRGDCVEFVWFSFAIVSFFAVIIPVRYVLIVRI